MISYDPTSAIDSKCLSLATRGRLTRNEKPLLSLTSSWKASRRGHRAVRVRLALEACCVRDQESIAPTIRLTRLVFVGTAFFLTLDLLLRRDDEDHMESEVAQVIQVSSRILAEAFTQLNVLFCRRFRRCTIPPLRHRFSRLCSVNSNSCRALPRHGPS